MKKTPILSVLALLYFFGACTHAQVLSTAETGGKGSSALIITGNAIYPKDFTVLANFWTQYGYGFTERLDVLAGYGNITAFGRTQHYATFSSNLGLLRRTQAGIDVAFYTNATIPLSKRDQACKTLLTFAPIASRPVKIGKLKLIPYGGVLFLAPVGDPMDKLFTSPEMLQAVIAGVAVPMGKHWIAFFEYNPGTDLRSAGHGYARVFPKNAP